jgi:hypothetical protein
MLLLCKNRIEHILADNEENLQLFGGDEEKFKSERNRLGGLLLLKDCVWYCSLINPR